MDPTPRQLFSDAEIRQFQALVSEHAGTSLSLPDATTLAHQLLRVLWVARAVAVRSSSESFGSVDGGPLPESPA